MGNNKAGSIYNYYKSSAHGNNLFGSTCLLLLETGKNQGLSQKQLAKKIGWFKANISALELGKFNPRFAALKKICDCTGIDFNEFVQENCRPNSDLILPKELDAGLAQFIGYFLGDGSFEKERIRLFEQRKEIAEKYE